MIESLFPHLRIDQLLNATLETLYMTGIAGLATLVLGIVLGVLLFLTSRGQLLQNRLVYSLISVLVNVFRSIPFIILIVLLIPFTKTLIGTILGADAALPALIVGAAPSMHDWLKLACARWTRESSKRRAPWVPKPAPSSFACCCRSLPRRWFPVLPSP